MRWPRNVPGLTLWSGFYKIRRDSRLGNPLESQDMSRFVFLIPLLPLLGFLFNLTVGVRILSRAARAEHGGEGRAPHRPSRLIALVACASGGSGMPSASSRTSRISMGFS